MLGEERRQERFAGCLVVLHQIPTLRSKAGQAKACPTTATRVRRWWGGPPGPAAAPPVALPAPCEMRASLPGRRDGGAPRGPGGPPHRYGFCSRTVQGFHRFTVITVPGCVLNPLYEIGRAHV